MRNIDSHNKKEKILRIRPYNMANFSGGSGYMPMFAMLAMIVAAPAGLFINLGLAINAKKEDGTLDYQIVKTRLIRIILPLALVLFALCLFAYVPNVLDYGGDLRAYWMEILWCAAVPTLGIYFVLFASAKFLDGKSKLTKVNWFFITLILIIILAVIGYLGLIFLDILSSQINYEYLY